MTTFKLVALFLLLHFRLSLEEEVKNDLEFRVEDGKNNHEIKIICSLGESGTLDIHGITQIQASARLESSEEILATINRISPTNVNTAYDGIIPSDSGGKIEGKTGILSLLMKPMSGVYMYECKVVAMNKLWKSITLTKLIANPNNGLVASLTEVFHHTCPSKDYHREFAKIGLQFGELERSNEDQEEFMNSKLSEMVLPLTSNPEKSEALFNRLNSLANKVIGISTQIEMIEEMKSPENITSCEDFRDKKGPRLFSRVTITNEDGVRVLCDTVTEGGGWTVFQRRIDGTLDFARTWSEYEDGFGSIESNFWLGLKTVRKMVATGIQLELRVDFKFEETYYFAKYERFGIFPANHYYRIHVDGYSGNAGDEMRSVGDLNYRSNFTTKDQDNDRHMSRNCASGAAGGWWHDKCGFSNLNGPWGTGVYWFHTSKKSKDISFTEMKIRCFKY